MRETWLTTIRADEKRRLDLKEIWYYRDLIVLFVRRNFKIAYQQTVLGPFWIIINPLITSVVFTVIFGNLAGLSTDEVPTFVFYMAGTNIWNLFSRNLLKNSTVLFMNRTVFDKVYFPRIIMPITNVLTNFIDYCVELFIFLIFWVYFLANGSFVPSPLMILLPLLCVEASFLGAGVGLVVSALTTRYRDLQIAVGFGVQLWMYFSPVVYTASSTGGLMRVALMINPMGPIVETARYMFFGSGEIPWGFLLLSVATTALLCFWGLRLFLKMEKTFMDTI